MALDSTWHFFPTTVVYDANPGASDKIVTDAVGGKLVSVKDGPAYALKDTNGNDISNITSNSDGQASQFYAQTLGGLMQFGDLVVWVWSSEVGNLLQSQIDAVNAAQAAAASAQAAAASAANGTVVVATTVSSSVRDVQPTIMAFDGNTDVPALASGAYTVINTVNADTKNQGVDLLAQDQLAAFYTTSDPDLAADYAARSKPIFGGYRGYLSPIPSTFNPISQAAVTAKVLGGDRPRVTLNLWVAGDSSDDNTKTVQRNGEATYDLILSGSFDSTVTSFVGSLPIGKNRPTDGTLWSFLFSFNGELDLATNRAYRIAQGLNPDTSTVQAPDALKIKARSATLRLVQVASAAASVMGATPGEFGAGGLLTGYEMDQDGQENYDWFRNFKTTITSQAQRDLCVGGADTYFHPSDATTNEDCRVRLRSQKATYAAAGVNRFVVFETTMGLDLRSNRGTVVATTAMQAKFFDQLAGCVYDGTVEALHYFSTPGGYESNKGAARGLALQRLALAAEAINRKWSKAGSLIDARTVASRDQAIAAAAADVDAKLASFSGGSGGSSLGPLDMTQAPYYLSTTKTAAQNGVIFTNAVKAAGRRGVTAPAGPNGAAYPLLGASFTDEDIVVKAEEATFAIPAVTDGSGGLGVRVERTLGDAISVDPPLEVEWGPRLPSGVAISSRFTAIQTSTDTGYSVFRRGDLFHIVSKDVFGWTWSGQGLADYDATTGYYFQAGIVPILGVGVRVSGIINGGPAEQMIVKGAQSGAQGLIVGCLNGTATSAGAGGSSATQADIVFAKVSGDFVDGENLVTVAGGFPKGAALAVAVGTVVGTVNGAPMLLANRVLEDTYGGVTQANITAGTSAGYGTGTKKPFRTDNTVTIRKISRDPVFVMKTNFDIAGAAGDQDNYLVGGNRPGTLELRGIFAPQFKCRINGAWNRAVQIKSCWFGTWDGWFEDFPNHAYLDQNAFGYGFELKSSSEANKITFQGRNVRHMFTTNPGPKSWPTTDINSANTKSAVLDFGTPRHNVIHDFVTHATISNSVDTHPGDVGTRFINGLVIGGGSGSDFNSSAVGYATRGFGTEWINCEARNVVNGFYIDGLQHDAGFTHEYLINDCKIDKFQFASIQVTDDIYPGQGTVVLDGLAAMGNSAPGNQPYYHEAISTGKNVSLTILRARVGGITGSPIRMRQGCSLRLLQLIVDLSTCGPNVGPAVRADATLASAYIDEVIYLQGTGTPPAFIRNAGGDTAWFFNNLKCLGPSQPPVYYTPVSGNPTFTVNRDVLSDTTPVQIGVDNSVTLTPHTSKPVYEISATLSAARTITLSSTAGIVMNGDTFEIVRLAGTGTQTLTVGTATTFTLAAGQWCKVRYNGAQWNLHSRGSL